MSPRVQPLLTSWVATLLLTAAARYAPGMHLDDEQALYLAGVLFTIGTAVAHRYVTPLARPRLSKVEPLVPASQVDTMTGPDDRPTPAPRSRSSKIGAFDPPKPGE